MLIHFQALVTIYSARFIAANFNITFKGFQMNMNKMKTSAQQGFTLIELMIVVAIIGILAAIAIPQYTKYIARAESATGLQAISALKTAVEDYYAQGGTVAPTLANLGTTSTASPLGTISSTLTATGTGGLLFTFDQKASATLKAGGSPVHTWTRTIDGAWTCASTVGADFKVKGC